MKNGDKVVCVDDNFEDSSDNPFRKVQLNLPRLGQTYTIRKTEKTPYGVVVYLDEVQNSKFFYNVGGLKEPGFSTNRFMPS